MKTILSILSDHTFITVGLGATLFGSISGILGTFAVLRKQSLVDNVISRTTLPGICIMFLITSSKNISLFLVGAFIAGIIASSIITYTTNNFKIKYGSVLGIVLLTYIQKTPNANQAGFYKILFGQADTLLNMDVKVMGVALISLLFLMLILWRQFKLLCFNREFGESLGMPMKKLDFLLTSLIVLAIAVGLQTVGVILMIAMIIVPALSARQWADKLWVMVLVSAIFGAILGTAGTIPTIMVMMSIITFLSVLFAPNKGIVWKRIRRRVDNKKITVKEEELVDVVTSN